MLGNRIIDDLKEHIDLQIKYNESKNLFHSKFDESLKFTESTINIIKQIDRISKEETAILIDYTTERTLQEFCRINQYFAYNNEDKNYLKEIYLNLVLHIGDVEMSADAISTIHYNKLKLWLQKTNPFAHDIYTTKESVLESVACSEYSEDLQKTILQLDKVQLLEPILDIGCGKDANLVRSFRKDGFEAYGIDRFSENLLWRQKADWLDFDYGIEKWGTIISNLGFSNHFVNNHLRKDGNFVGYAKKYMEILNALKIGGSFHYSPNLPFIEQYLEKENFAVTNYEIKDYKVKVTVIKRLK